MKTSELFVTFGKMIICGISIIGVLFVGIAITSFIINDIFKVNNEAMTMALAPIGGFVLFFIAIDLSLKVFFKLESKKREAERQATTEEYKEFIKNLYKV